MIDDIDRKLLELLQADCRLSNAELAQAVGLTVSSAHERVRKLERRGIVTGYGARVDAEKLGKNLLSFVRMSVGTTAGETVEIVRGRVRALCEAEPDILECHGVAGEDCFVLKLRTAGPAALEDLICKIRGCAQNSRSITSIVLSTYKEGSAVAPAAAAKGDE